MEGAIPSGSGIRAVGRQGIIGAAGTGEVAVVARPLSMEHRDWDRVVSSRHSDAGSFGVDFLSADDGTLVVKEHAAMPNAVLAAEIGKLFGLATASTVCVRRDSEEGAKLWRKISELNRELFLKIVEKSQLLVMQYVPCRTFLELKDSGTDMDSFVTSILRGESDDFFYELGKLAVFDELVANTDRLLLRVDEAAVNDANILFISEPGHPFRLIALDQEVGIASTGEKPFRSDKDLTDFLRSSGTIFQDFDQKVLSKFLGRLTRMVRKKPVQQMLLSAPAMQKKLTPIIQAGIREALKNLTELQSNLPGIVRHIEESTQPARLEDFDLNMMQRYISHLRTHITLSS